LIDELLMSEDLLATQPGLEDGSAQLDAEIRGKFMTKMQMLGSYGPSSVRIEDEEIGIGAWGERAFAAGQSGQPGGFQTHPA
jgi:hypothetical protein